MTTKTATKLTKTELYEMLAAAVRNTQPQQMSKPIETIGDTRIDSKLKKHAQKTITTPKHTTRTKSKRAMKKQKRQSR